jgi:transposase, IS5 family
MKSILKGWNRLKDLAQLISLICLFEKKKRSKSKIKSAFLLSCFFSVVHCKNKITNTFNTLQKETTKKMRRLYNPQKSLFSQWSNHQISTELQEISTILDDLPEMRHWVHEDLNEGKSLNSAGAHGMTSDQVLRAAILKQQNGWSYQFLELQCLDSQMTKAFLNLNEGESFGKSCLQQNISKIKSSTWQQINDHIVQYAADRKLERGRTIRVDSTVVDAPIHPPSDSSLLYDCIRVANHALKKIRKMAGKKWYTGVSTKQAKSLMLSILNSSTSDQRKEYYRQLLRISRCLEKELKILLARMDKADLPPKYSRPCERLVKVYMFLPLIMSQAKRRVLLGQSVPAAEKIVSIFEEHTDVIVKGRRETEFGHKMFLTAGESGLILDCQLTEGNPSDSNLFMDLLNRQKEIYGRVPRQTSADGGFASQQNVQDAKEFGVRDVCFSKKCGLSIEEMVKSAWVFHKLRNFRAGIEGVISVLKRVFGFARATWKGVMGFGSYVKSAVVAYNLTVLARLKLA